MITRLSWAARGKLDDKGQDTRKMYAVAVFKGSRLEELCKLILKRVNQQWPLAHDRPQV